MRARLVYQSRKRGTLESDLILSTFAREHLPGMPEAELREYDKVRLPFGFLFRLVVEL
jgi:succinate dehydrogenase assembly factor 2